MAAEDETSVQKTEFQIAFNIKKARSRLHEGGEEIISRVLTEGINGERKWFLTIRPREKGDDKDYVGMYLDLHEDSHEAEVMARYSFHILDGCNRALISDDSIAAKIFERGGGWGFGKSIKRRDLLKNHSCYTEGDTLRILCKVEVVGESKSKVPSIQVIDDLEKLYDSKEFADVKIICGGSTFHCSKSILAARSDIFKAMFSHDMKENRAGEVVVEDIEPATMEIVLRFIYTGRFIFKSSAITVEVYKAADKYCLDRLKVMCEEAILAKLSKENVWELFSLANANSLTILEEGIIQNLNSWKPEDLTDIIQKEAIKIQNEAESK